VGGVLGHFPVYLQCIWLDSPARSFSLIPPSLPKTVSTGFIILFSYKDAKHMDHIHCPSDTPSPPLPPTSTGTPYPHQQDLLYILVLRFIVQRVFPVLIHTCIYCILIKSVPSITLSIPPLFNSFQRFRYASSHTNSTQFHIHSVILFSSSASL
jgi:hypothetical protein